MKRNFRTLSIEVVSDEPPIEFRIFTAGIVDTIKGRFKFDDKAAKAVLAAYETHGIDLMIDYDHASLGAENAIDPALSGRAAGWFNIELRNGELWAVNVRWTPPAAEALRRKEWRFMSPAFATDKAGRVTSLLNVALTNIPATHQLEPLVAASTSGAKMNPDLVAKALKALEDGDDAAAMEILKGMITSAASDSDKDGAEGDGAEGTAPPKAAAVEEPKVVDASEDTDDSDDEDKPEKKASNKALRGMICRLTGTKTLAEATLQVSAYRTSHVTLETERTKLATERAVIESAERRSLVTELVKLGAEFPSTVWADDKGNTVKSRWLAMPITELRGHVSEQRAARGTKKPALQPAVGDTADGVTGLDARELEICKSSGCDPKVFLELKTLRAKGV